jgi:hypothetical protein
MCLVSLAVSFESPAAENLHVHVVCTVLPNIYWICFVPPLSLLYITCLYWRIYFCFVENVRIWVKILCNRTLIFNEKKGVNKEFTSHILGVYQEAVWNSCQNTVSAQHLEKPLSVKAFLERNNYVSYYVRKPHRTYMYGRIQLWF